MKRKSKQKAKPPEPKIYINDLTEKMLRAEMEKRKARLFDMKPACPQFFVDECAVRNFTRPRPWLTIYECKRCGYWHTKIVDQRGKHVE